MVWSDTCSHSHRKPCEGLRPRVPAPQHRLSTLEKSHFTDAQWDLPARRRCGEEMPVLHLSQRECRAVSAPPAAFSSATRSAQTPMGSRGTYPSPACTSSPWGLPWTYHWQLHLGLKIGQAPHLPQIHTPMDYRHVGLSCTHSSYQPEVP